MAARWPSSPSPDHYPSAEKPATDLTAYNAVALIDTGSTTSGITPRVAAGLDLTKRGIRPLGSAHGEAQAERYIFRVGIRPPSSEPAFPYIFDDVSGFELGEMFHLDALLGMDVPSQCDFSISRQGHCRLVFG